MGQGEGRKKKKKRPGAISSVTTGCVTVNQPRPAAPREKKKSMSEAHESKKGAAAVAPRSMHALPDLGWRVGSCLHPGRISDPS